MQETYLTRNNITEIEDYVLLRNGNSGRRFGTGFLMHQSLKAVVINCKPLLEKLNLKQIRNKARNIIIVNKQAQTKEKGGSKKENTTKNCKVFLRRYQKVIKI